MNRNCMFDGKKCYFENAEELAAWAQNGYGWDLTLEEAMLILDYVKKHGYELHWDTQNQFILVNVKEPECAPVTMCLEELVEYLRKWNFDLLLDDEITGEQREIVFNESKIIDGILGWDAKDGYCIGTPTVKEMIAILRKLPEDYRVTCCGTNNHLYFFHEGKYLTIDCEHYLG